MQASEMWVNVWVDARVGFGSNVYKRGGGVFPVDRDVQDPG